MAAPRIVIDGNQAYGVTVGTSGVVTINSVAYKVNNVRINRAVEEAKDNVPDGGVGRRRKTASFDDGELELQLAASDTVLPIFGNSFSMTVDPAYGAENWCLDPVSPEQTNGPGDIRTITVSIWKLYNGASPSLVN